MPGASRVRPLDPPLTGNHKRKMRLVLFSNLQINMSECTSQFTSSVKQSIFFFKNKNLTNAVHQVACRFPCHTWSLGNNWIETVHLGQALLPSIVIEG